MSRIGNRYLLDQPILSLAGGRLYNGKDMSLQRKVFLYLIDCVEETYRHDYIRKIGRVSSFIDERFMHIMDLGVDDTRVFAVMSNCEGNPLLQVLKHHNLTLQAILSLTFELGKGLQDAKEEGIVGFPVTAENIWFIGKEPKIINYWSEGERNRCGARGLCSLLYQLCVRSEFVPDSLEDYEKNLWLALRDSSTEHKEAVIAITRSVFQGEDSLTLVMRRFRDLLETDEHESKYADVISTYSDRLELDIADLDEEEESKEETHSASRFFIGKWILFGVALVSIAFLLGIFWGWVEDSIKSEPGLERGKSISTETETLPKTPKSPETTKQPTEQQTEEPTEQPTPQRTDKEEEASNLEDSEINSGTNEEGVAIPKLVGLTQEEAEKRALSEGLHYQYFLEPNKQERGIVFKQDPEAGSPATRGDSVTFWVSKGGTP